MNPEITGNPEQNTEKTEWDNLSDEVEFKGGTVDTAPVTENVEPVAEKSERDRKREYLDIAFEAVYSKNLEHLFFDRCFEGTPEERNNPDAYVFNNAIGLFMSDEDQQDMQRRAIEGEPVTAPYRDKFKTGIVDLIMETGMEDEVIGDLFLRQKHADTIAGRYEKRASDDGLSEEELNIKHELEMKKSALRDIIWGADEFFYQSEEAKSLLSDPDFITMKYGVPALVERNYKYNKKLIPKLTKEDLTGSYIKYISEYITNICNNGDATIKGIIDDPFCRKKHFDALYESEINGVKNERNLNEIWTMDADYQESGEYASSLFQFAAKNPDIYRDVDTESIDSLTSEALEKIPEEKLMEIVKAYEKRSKKGDALLMKTLLPILGLEKNPPKLKYRSTKEADSGCFKRLENEVVIYRKNLELGSRAEENVLDSASSVGSFFGTKKLKNSTFYRMGVVAHELWHAHQWSGEGVDDESREKYRKNFVYYMNGKKFYGAYRDQLIEREAWAFGEKMEKRCREIYEKGGEQ